MDVYIIFLFFVFLLAIFIAFFIGKSLGKRLMYEVMQSVIDQERKKAVDQSRHVLKGQFNEHLSPFQKDFPVKASECRFLGAPIDFICFNGLDEKNVEEIVFVEVKSGKSQLNQTERSIKKAVENKKIRFETYRIKEE
jgi:predicted Holliday junction resolvase-like endonuclease